MMLLVDGALGNPAVTLAFLVSTFTKSLLFFLKMLLFLYFAH